MRIGRLQIDFRRYKNDAFSWHLDICMWSKK